ncbi:MAG: ppnK [Chlamydiales bacterium]|jgi:NAD+ kinase|nr:ppnK [Chlamydiales bacterium]
MIIALFPNASKHNACNIAREVYKYLTDHGVEVVVDDQEAAVIGASPLSSVPLLEINFAISLGGDGTILRLVHRYPGLLAPIIGINLGNLGFMADIPLAELYTSLDQFLAGNYRIENRITIEGKNPLKNQSFFALNEVIVHRSGNSSLIELALYVDGNYLSTFRADGVIISTPSGSTAYSLAAGGPILTPELEALVLTPICPHTISNRPIVFMPQQEIKIEYISDYKPVEVTFDGIPSFYLETGESFCIKRRTQIFRLVSLLQRDYYSILRSKLGWAGKIG